MATTTNYGWTTPDDTALVKDGASAIRTLGTSVDTTTKNLNPETTLGDIAYRSSTSNVNTRLGIGSTSQVLTVTGGVPVWATPAAGGGMTLISTTTLSGAETTLASIPQTYNSLFLVITGATFNTGNGQIVCWANSSANNNCTQSISKWETGSGGTATGGNAAPMYLQGNAYALRTDANNAYSLRIDNYTSTTAYKPFSIYSAYLNSSSARNAIIAGGTINTNTAISALVLGQDSGNAANAGTVLLYGVK